MSNRKLADAARVAVEGAGWRARRDAGLLRWAGRRLGAAGAGRLRVTMPSGVTALVGTGARAEASIRLHDFRVLPAALLRGALGFAECYIEGGVECDELRAVFDYFIRHEAALRAAGGGMFGVRAFDRLAHRLRANTRRGSRRNIAAHYDLGNDFYARWLDAGMTYSSGIFRDRHTSLEAAQEEKYRVVLEALDLRPGQRVLEVGCGWGGMAARLARAGAEVDAITLSQAQLAHARARLHRDGLDDRASVQLRDYRDTGGIYDRAVSVEMIEAVGQENWPAYFTTLAARLDSGGIAVLQAITIDERWFDAYRAGPDFIQRYVFPGGMLPTVSAMRACAARAGFAFETVERFGPSYARTLAAWRARFDAAWPEIRALGFDERFRRLWTYYLVYCEAGFDSAAIDVGIYRLRKL